MQPARFDSYWDNVDSELGALPAKPVLEMLPLRSNQHATVYSLRLTSIGPYRIFGYLSVPQGTGPFPALLQTPRYGSVNHIPDYNDRIRYVCLQIMHRGQRLADEPYAASYPGLLTDGIEDADEFRYRGIAADCLRAAEYLMNRDDVDPSRVAIQGDDLALITASRRSGFTLANVSGLVFYRLNEQRQKSSVYPVEEVNDFCRAFPEMERDIEQILNLFDPLNHCDTVACEVIMSVGDDPSWFQPLADILETRYLPYRLTHRGGTDHDAVDSMVSERLGVPAMSRFIRTFDR